MDHIVLSKEQFRQLRAQLEVITNEVQQLKKQPALDDVWLDTAQACELLKISTRQLARYKSDQVIPFSQYGTKVYFKASDIQAHLDKHYSKQALNKG